MGAAVATFVLYCVFFGEFGGFLPALIGAALVGGCFRMGLSAFVTPKGERSYSSYRDTKAYTLLKSEGYGDFKYSSGAHAWKAATVNQR
jgi:hypothetical protein